MRSLSLFPLFNSTLFGVHLNIGLCKNSQQSYMTVFHLFPIIFANRQIYLPTINMSLNLIFASGSHRSRSIKKDINLITVLAAV